MTVVSLDVVRVDVGGMDDYLENCGQLVWTYPRGHWTSPQSSISIDGCCLCGWITLRLSTTDMIISTWLMTVGCWSCGCCWCGWLSCTRSTADMNISTRPLNITAALDKYRLMLLVWMMLVWMTILQTVEGWYACIHAAIEYHCRARKVWVDFVGLDVVGADD